MKADLRSAARTGRVWIEGGIVKSRSTCFGHWALRVSDLRLVGESTNENGPFADDWTLVFATGADTWHEASFDAFAGTDFLAQLEHAIGAALKPQLVACTTFDSRVLWPPELGGRPVFRYDPAPPRSVLDRLWFAVFGPSGNIQTFTEEVRDYLVGQT